MNAKGLTQQRGVVAALGPGIIYAGAAIGVSHLVQSTRAGATYGYALVWAIVAAHLLKYPFFEFGHRYAAGTGENLLCGYRRVGRWALPVYLLVACALGLPSITLLAVVTAGMATQIIAVDISITAWSAALLGSCVVLLLSGGYPLLDRVMKYLMALLAVGTAIAVAAAVSAAPSQSVPVPLPEVWDRAGIFFLVALMGWMPTPIDASVWPSLWMQERIKQTCHRPTLREALFDFKLGYFGSLAAALMFLALGALVMFPAGETIAGSADGFAAQLVAMYTKALGGWSWPLIAAAAFLAMFSTMLTVLDGYPRVFMAGYRLLRPSASPVKTTPYWAYLVVVVAGAMLILVYLTSHMRHLLDFVTTVAFLSAPLFAYLNYRAIFAAPLPDEAIPPTWLRVLSWIGLAFLVCFSLLFLWVRFGIEQ